MCGIFGYVGKGNAVKIVYEGLKTLEYRGYDSWGIAYNQKGKLTTQKEIGKLPLTLNTTTFSNLSIGHTRWATHGGVVRKNAHPHVDCTGTIAVVHNGIIENYSNLKANLVKNGHKFKSETDTEVFSHLIEEFSQNMSFDKSLRKAFGVIEGLNAFLIINSRTEKLYAVKNGSPMVIGEGKSGDFYIASDPTGIMRYTNKVFFVEDNIFLEIGNSIKSQNKTGKSERIVFQTLSWQNQSPSKGKFKHFLLKEIFEQPECIQNVVNRDNSEIEHFAKRIKDAYGTYAIGCGTASYAALAGQYLFSKIAGKHINFSVGSEFTYLQDFLTKKSAVLAISQSGETIDIIDPVNRAKNIGSTILSITNAYGSTLFRKSDLSLLLEAGPEVAVVGTKSYTSMVSLLLLLSYAIKGETQTGKSLLLRAISDIQITLNTNIPTIKKAANIISQAQSTFAIGRGLSYATALETALKIKETALIHAEGFAGGELKHGVLALIEKGTPCIVIAPNDETYNDIISNSQEIKTRGGYIIGIGPRQNDVFDMWIKTADCGSATLLSQVVISQLLAYYAALKRGVEDPDKPRNLAKSVTVK